MSYNLEISVKVEGCGKFIAIAKPSYSSPTYNLGKMFRACMGWDFRQCHHYRCADCIDYITKGIRELRNNPANYTQFEPENGWGRVPTALLTLETLLTCIREQEEELPLSCLYVSW